MNNKNSVASGVSGGIVILGIALAFAFGGFNLTIFFLALAVATLVSSLGSLNPHRVYGSLQGTFWLLILALFFATDNWIWFLVGAGISAIMGALFKPIIASLIGMGLFGMTSMANQPRQQAQQPYYQPTQPSYEQGYRPAQSETYQEGEKQYRSSDGYEQPQAQYPQEMPPQQ
ncbi:MAG TPA: hypothetical protein VFU49_21655 [Ktedonobacteraceae bacterium]|nr:hypothetical protein [Ktedonobacteraceae bacterium]